MREPFEVIPVEREQMLNTMGGHDSSDARIMRVLSLHIMGGDEVSPQREHRLAISEHSKP